MNRMARAALRVAVGKSPREQSPGARLTFGICAVALLSLALSLAFARPSAVRLPIMLAQCGYGYGYGYNGCENEGELTVSKTTVKAGESLTVSGDGFEEDTNIDIFIESTKKQITSAQSNSSGAFSKKITIPASTDPGQHILTAEGDNPDGDTLVLSADIEVTAAGGGGGGDDDDDDGDDGGTDADDDSGDDAVLPRTGTDILRMLATAMLFVALGLTVREQASKRRSAELD